ncbi:TfuA-like protein [Streptomyces sp. NPDC095613]|uniref:TfuA-like protein n=1 Tax=Streptomyces sp. NPDC095613 TaxID=3155540 RepID=UPI00332F6D04
MIHVFTGPTLSPDDPALSHPRFTARPPIRHGDLFDSRITDSDTVVIIDGLYHHTPAVRHKEIIWALGRGVRVLGAASIGALRAAELAPCGMVGVGEIFHAYASGTIEGDDEVAVGQSTDGDLRSFTWPLVNVRHVLKLGVAEGAIEAGTAADVLSRLGDVYYAHRSLTAISAVSRRCGAEGFGQWLRARLAEDRHFGDLKRTDALQALNLALSLEGTPERARPRLEWRTRCFRQWANAFATQTVDGMRLATRHRIAYQQIFDPSFKHVWWDYLTAAGGGVELPGLPQPLACAVVHPDADLTDQATVNTLLAHETAADRTAVAHYAALNEETSHTHRGFFPEAIKDSVARHLLTTVWHVQPEELEEESWARGFQGSRDAVETAKLFVLGFLHDQKGSR